MTTKRTKDAVAVPNLDNLTLSRKEGWRDYTHASRRMQPDLLSKKEIRRLSESAREEYKDLRDDWHDNLGPFKTPQLAALHEDLWDVMDSNAQDGHHSKGAVALDGFPGLGKSIAVETFAKEFHRRQIRRHGEFTSAGDERWPVCRIGMRGNTSMKDFNSALCDFYAHPGRLSGNTDQLRRRALDYVLKCETRMLIIDDLHFLHWQHHGGIEISNHFKYIANDFPVTLVSIGIGLIERGVLMDASYDEALAQTSRRTTVLQMKRYNMDSPQPTRELQQQRREWRTLLTTIEHSIVLGDKHVGMLAEDLSDYLYVRSTGHIGSLMDLIRKGCTRAIRSGVETLNVRLLDAVKIDSAAEKARKELEEAFRTRRFTTKLKAS